MTTKRRGRALYVLAYALALVGVPAEAPAAGELRLCGVPQMGVAASATLVARTRNATSAELDLWQTHGGSTIRRYDVDLTKRLHLIVIGDDFAWFAHVHPALGPNGHFHIVLHVPRPGRYYIYADSKPQGLADAVFRFALPLGDGPRRKPEVAPGPATVRTGPYEVALSSLALHAGSPTMLRARVLKNGRPAGDLQPYLGVAAHAVFVDARTLRYLHVHPAAVSPAPGGEMSGMPMDGGEAKSLPAGATSVPPEMMLHVAAASPGTYKLWLQFRGGGRLYVAPFVLTAR